MRWLLIFLALPAFGEGFAHKQWQGYCDDAKCTMIPRALPHLSMSRATGESTWRFWDFETVDAKIDGRDVVIDGVMPADLSDANVLEVDSYFGLSLDGFKAVMTWADEYQGQLGVAQNWRVDVINEELMKTRAREMFSEIEGCEFFDGQETGAEREVFAARVPNRPDLRFVNGLCWMGAYNANSMGWLMSAIADDVRPVTNTGESFDSAPYDSPTSEIFSYYKGRGVGDCTTESLFKFDGEVYKLSHQMIDDDCDGLINPVYVEAED